MTAKHLGRISASLVCASMLLGACVPVAANESSIATAVAQTVQAQETERSAFTPTATTIPPTLAPLTSPTPLSTRVPPTAPAPGSGNIVPCYRAEYVADVTIPDGTIVAPGASFMKRWSVKNTGSCTWNSSYKFVFMDGDVLGGAYVYNFPGVAAPKDTVEIPIQLYAPSATGSYAGYWKIQAPDGTIFGVGEYDQSLWVKIVVGSGTPQNNKTATVYDITAVSYTITRRCTSANTFWQIYVNLTSNGPIKTTFRILQSDGNGQGNIRLTFTQAETLTFDYGEWSQRTITSSPNPRWVQVITTAPTYREWPKSELLYLCGQ
ncbi:MAG TPA: NBR1-Ig-like domain-containing protein [Anaerolineales bacterium]|nr:NBR1-Ig-like domain-containing protein [Anaerolineales bacterium]